MDVDLTAPPVRAGDRPVTTGLEIPHDQLDQFSPPEIRARLIEVARALPGVFTGPSQVSVAALRASWRHAATPLATSATYQPR
ncbi:MULTISPECIES: hypothetical protein [unclassified Pseudofrankia]|uniref:hypothetical protein n=1 Tax=unclassified Pseudofrankia TaxID=2994372 RepID=UPI0008D9DD72|nr:MULTISPECIES: hypothetical protein [unclassified Pseudofrankia]MDT3441045.1 hypothetical protein [Pseudofrankia sp. BMG5.37]OHV42550.1 hypothetical protein BCD48_30920 [Pseudofrankia sp. BMG5.36]